MKKTPKLTALLIALSLPVTAAPIVKPSGIRVIRETVGEGFEGLTPFNTQAKGTSVALIIDAGGGSIIKLDTDADGSTIRSFTDDKGTDLLVKKKGFNRDGFGPFPKISKDGKAAMVEISSGAVPAAGATTVTVKGALVIHTASEKMEIKSEPFALVKGTQFNVGDIALKVTKVGKPSFGEDALEVEFETGDKAIEIIAGVKFFDAAGDELKFQGSGSSRMGFGKKYTYGRTYGLEKAVDGNVVVQFDLWTDLAESEVPIDVTVGIGG